MHQNHEKPNVTLDERIALKNLSKRDDIVIQSADKGGKVVILSIKLLMLKSAPNNVIDNVITIIGPITDFSENKLADILIFGDKLYSTAQNSLILKNTIIFLKTSERFDIPLF